MSRTGFQYALAALGAIVADPEAVDIGVARSIHAGLSAAANTGRELSDLEQLALDNLLGQLTPTGEPEVVEAAEGAGPTEPGPHAEEGAAAAGNPLAESAPSEASGEDADGA